MKNVELLKRREDVHAGCFRLLRSDVFKASYDARGIVYEWIDAYAEVPRIICDYSDYALERSHFYPYFGVLPRRNYGDQRALSDLYYFHEQGHSIIAGYQVNQPFSLWVNRLTQEEARTSVLSELAIYFHLPDLRKEVFQDKEIWADRFLSDAVKVHAGKEDRLPSGLSAASSNWDVFNQDPELFTLFVMEMRASLMQSSAPETLDEQERLIHGYAANNFKWADIWRPIRDLVEKQMLILKQASAIDRGLAIEAHHQWILQHQAGGMCPFEPQARAFYDVMEAFKAKNDLAFMDKT
jgi:hypothetical protein